MTFQDRKDKGKNWEKVKKKREELNDETLEEANHPKSIYKQVDDDLQEKEDKKLK
ncbi:hypothetical protein [Pedobacter psychrophilus]|uniref:hypothetical protein n=1 Tax=Pedobacter psychrophilus TaxID=1826909 RepID=UPI000B113E96|nr:hypothetical protein [Pedobacter psychrophilus]